MSGHTLKQYCCLECQLGLNLTANLEKNAYISAIPAMFGSISAMFEKYQIPFAMFYLSKHQIKPRMEFFFFLQ